MPELKDMLEKLYQQDPTSPTEGDGYFYTDSASYGEAHVILGPKGMGPHFHQYANEVIEVVEGDVAVVMHGQAEQVHGSIQISAMVVHQVISLDGWAYIKISTPGTPALDGFDTFPTR